MERQRSGAMPAALGVVVKIRGRCIVVRKNNDGAHINVAELDAIVKGVNLAVKWQLRKLTLVADSAKFSSS